jgi:XTP/dITP diphosphohydrolase
MTLYCFLAYNNMHKLHVIFKALVMRELILATSNPGKIAELQAMLPAFHCISQQTLGIKDADETGLTFIENALIKARHASFLSKKPALADDSGLVVPALNGEPGIYSARFAGRNATTEENIDLLLNRLDQVPDAQRGAFFYCAIVFVEHAHDPTPLITTGKFSGIISQQRQGSNGFGYDPIFYLPDYQCTLAQLPSTIKNTISHRAIALQKLQKSLFWK